MQFTFYLQHLALGTLHVLCIYIYSNMNHICTIFIFILSIGLWCAQSCILLWVLWVNDNSVLQVVRNTPSMSLTIVQFPLGKEAFQL